MGTKQWSQRSQGGIKEGKRGVCVCRSHHYLGQRCYPRSTDHGRGRGGPFLGASACTPPWIGFCRSTTTRQIYRSSSSRRRIPPPHATPPQLWSLCGISPPALLLPQAALAPMPPSLSFLSLPHNGCSWTFQFSCIFHHFSPHPPPPHQVQCKFSFRWAPCFQGNPPFFSFFGQAVRQFQ